METTQRATPETCAYCGTPVDGERAYRRHLTDAHDPDELGAIDRRRYEHYSPEPNRLRAAGTEAVTALARLQYPVEGTTMLRYACYGALSAAFVATLLGVGQ